MSQLYYPEYVELTGNIHSALVLSLIVKSYLGNPLPENQDHTHWWLVMTHVDWLNSLGLRRGQSRKALQNLKDRKLIETVVLRHEGNPSTHIRLLIAKENSYLDKAPTVEDFQNFAKESL